MAFPAIIAAISGIASLVKTGADVVETVTGERPEETEEGLAAAREAMTPEQRERFDATMAERIEMYEAETERLAVQGGRLNAETLEQFSQPARDEIGLLRMTTRPKVTLKMAHVLLLPIYVVVFDMAATLLNWFLSAIGKAAYAVPLLADKFLESGTLYMQLYDAAAYPAAGVVMTYMTLREMGKAGGPKQAAKGIGQQIGGSIKSVLDLVRGR